MLYEYVHDQIITTAVAANSFIWVFVGDNVVE